MGGKSEVSGPEEETVRVLGRVRFRGDWPLRWAAMAGED